MRRELQDGAQASTSAPIVQTRATTTIIVLKTIGGLACLGGFIACGAGQPASGAFASVVGLSLFVGGRMLQ